MTEKKNNSLGFLEVRGKIFTWKKDVPGSWFFVQLSSSDSKYIHGLQPKKVGRGYVPVRVKIGETLWTTTLFPTQPSAYLLSIKASVRKKEKLSAGDEVSIQIEVL